MRSIVLFVLGFSFIGVTGSVSAQDTEFEQSGIVQNSSRIYITVFDGKIDSYRKITVVKNGEVFETIDLKAPINTRAEKSTLVLANTLEKYLSQGYVVETTANSSTIQPYVLFILNKKD